jgi:hypothetical protein
MRAPAVTISALLPELPLPRMRNRIAMREHSRRRATAAQCY